MNGKSGSETNGQLLKKLMFGILLSTALSATCSTSFASVGSCAGAVTLIDLPENGYYWNAKTNVNGVIAGSYLYFPGKVAVGFVNNGHGVFTSIAVPDASDTLVSDINQNGDITGFYSDKNEVSHGYVRSASGVITVFDPPGSTSTYPVAIHSDGVITGDYVDSTGKARIFTRDARGTFSTFDIGLDLVYSRASNQDGSIVGVYTLRL